MTGRKALIRSGANQQMYSAYIVWLRVFEALMKSYPNWEGCCSFSA